MNFIEISNLDAAGNDLFASGDSFLTELQPTETTQIFGGWRSGGGRRNSGPSNSTRSNIGRRNSGRRNSGSNSRSNSGGGGRRNSGGGSRSGWSC